MATSGAASGAFSGRSSFRLEITVARLSVDAPNNRSRWRWILRVHNTSGSSATWSGGSGSFTATVNGSRVWSGSASPFDFRDGATYHNVRSGEIWISHGANGAKTFSIAGTASSSTIFGSASASGSVVADVISHPAPSNVLVERVSDSQQRLSWSSSVPVNIQARTNDGAWSGSNNQPANVSSTLIGTSSNRKYQFRVRAKYGSTWSSWVNSPVIYTTPAAPTGVSAARSGNNIRVDASGKPPYAQSYDVRDGGTTVASNVSLPWTHSSPNPAVTHQYTVRARRSSGGSGSTTLYSGWSAASNVVQLQAPPNAPTNLSPNGAVFASDGDWGSLSWRHNPVDSSDQEAYTLRVRDEGGAWITGSDVVSGDESVSLVDAFSSLGFTPTPGVPVEWAVRTRGSHPDYGPYSSTATMLFIDRPGVAVVFPDENVVESSTVTVEWSYEQGQDYPQSQWEVELQASTGETVEVRAGSGAASSVELRTPLTEGEWTVLVRAATGDIWSEWDVRSFTVAFDPPAKPSITGEWDESAGVVRLQVVSGDPVEPVEDRTNLCSRPTPVANGDWLVTDGVVVPVSPRAGGSSLMRTAPANPVGSLMAFSPVLSAGGPFVSVVPGEPVTVSVWVRSSVATEVLWYAGWRDVDGAQIGVDAATSVGGVADEWTQLGVTFTPPEGAVWLVDQVFVFRDGRVATTEPTDVYVTDCLIEHTDEVRSWFSGDLDEVIVDGVSRRPVWTGTPHQSASVTTDFVTPGHFVVERSIDGVVWERVAVVDEAVDLDDTGSPSYGDIRYRVTAVTPEGAASVSDVVTVEARSGALWLSGGPGFTTTARLPLNPVVEITPGRQRALKAYAGRSVPVAVSGEMTSRVASVSGVTADHPLSGEETAPPAVLTGLAHATDDLFLLRTPDGDRLIGQVPEIPLSRQGSVGSSDDWNGIWAYSFTLTEAT